MDYIRTRRLKINCKCTSHLIICVFYHLLIKRKKYNAFTTKKYLEIPCPHWTVRLRKELGLNTIDIALGIYLDDLLEYTISDGYFSKDHRKVLNETSLALVIPSLWKIYVHP